MAKNRNKSRSGDPRRRAEHAQLPPEPITGPTSASAWVSHVPADIEDVRLPSGNVARIRRVGPEAFMSQDIMPDTISPIVEKAIASKRGLRPSDQAQLARDPKKLGAVMEMMDRLLVYAVVSPKVQMPPVCQDCGELNTVATEAQHDVDAGGHLFNPSPRDENVLYADRVDMEDKTFIMNYCIGGTRDLERFRQQRASAVGGVPAGEARPVPTV